MNTELKWSKYNFLFNSEKFGHLLYNSLSNCFFAVDEEVFPEINSIRNQPEAYDFSSQPELFFQLHGAKIVLSERDEENAINVIKLQRSFIRYNSEGLLLSLAPTRGCNFNCSYCYEKDRRPVRMDERVEDGIIAFIERFHGIRYLSIVWYGGEPLLEFDTIRRLTRKIQGLKLPFAADMTTNGYLLTPQVASELEELKVKNLQIAIDGTREVHDTRRVLMNGGPTYDRIMQNIDHLVTVWKGKIHFRVNVDRQNRDNYFPIYRALHERFQGKRIDVYPGLVRSAAGVNPDLDCHMGRFEASQLAVDMFKEVLSKADTVKPDDISRYYPQARFSGCTANMKNFYVIGPSGEIYKCWHDIGIEKMTLGTIFDEQLQNVEVVANYMVATDPFDDPECRQCSYLPVCTGGCPQLRYEKKFNKIDHDSCTKFRDRLPELLEIYYHMKQSARKDCAKTTGQPKE